MTTYNQNMLSPLGFSFHIKRTPALNDFVQSVDLPGISLGSVDHPNPFKTLPVPGDHVTFGGDVVIKFKINEDLSNYISIFNWMVGLGFPDEWSQYKELYDKDKTTGEGIYSDGTLTVLSSAMNPIVRIKIHDMFPVDLTPLTFNTEDTGVTYNDASATFKFKNYYFETV